jgi:hypothetical protein
VGLWENFADYLPASWFCKSFFPFFCPTIGFPGAGGCFNVIFGFKTGFAKEYTSEIICAHRLNLPMFHACFSCGFFS